MSRLRSGGCEVSASTVGGEDVTGVALTRDTTFKRTGLASYKADTGAGAVESYVQVSIGAVANRTLFVRAYAYLSHLPDATSNFFTIEASTVIAYRVRLTSAGKLQLWDASAQIGSDSAVTLTTGVWYRLEMKVVFDANSDATDVEFKVDGTTEFADTPGSPITLGSGHTFRIGYWGTSGSQGANKVTHWDDVAVNDEQGSANNTWPGDGKIILMMPTSDSQRGSWTGGAGGTTNLWEALNNVPPIGTASETDLTQIESADSSGDNATDEYRGNCGSYTAAGIGASDTVNFVRAICHHGEDVGTNTKTGSFGFQSNPSAAYSAFTYGGDVGALGTWSTNWDFATSSVDAPSVTLGSNLILAVRKTDTGTRVASVCFLGAIVDYTPAAAASDLNPRFLHRSVQQAVNRAAHF